MVFSAPSRTPASGVPAARRPARATSGTNPRMTDPDPLDEQLMVQAFARLVPRALGISCGIVVGSTLFLATLVLLVQARFAASGAPVGPHLALLGNFFPGYAVTRLGAFVGLAYGFVSGFLFGVVVAFALNLYHGVYLAVLRRRIRGAGIDHGL